MKVCQPSRSNPCAIQSSPSVKEHEEDEEESDDELAKSEANEEDETDLDLSRNCWIRRGNC
ncbi:unnamed protein product [Linum tenue]|uniref:Uncharacterized protein n=1 Tax=Linum tenue TaxID=586396 RepID=A0AAV0KTJ6_9ROSI|nr:unnamed protein product [Linum tenue]